jgi:hypothetical protein
VPNDLILLSGLGKLSAANLRAQVKKWDGGVGKCLNCDFVTATQQL